jgi:hypothetical protein
MHPDSFTRGAHLYNVTARIQDDLLHFTGLFDAAELLPVLVFSVGVPWVQPCVDSVCCLWDVARRYKDDDLVAAIGKECDPLMDLTGKALMKGSTTTAAAGGARQWDLTTRVHPNFVAMLFLCITPVFYMYHEVVPIQWIERESATWSASWYGEPCHVVLYPDGREVCIHCSNPKPPHSIYVFSADWFQTFECKWRCTDGYSGPGCEVALDTVIYAFGGVAAVLFVAAAVFGAVSFWCNPRSHAAMKSVAAKEGGLPAVVSPEAEPKQPAGKTAARSEMIAFKDSAVGEIRIKFL